MDLYHFSEDPGIDRFVPHVPATNPTQPPSVWAIDEFHAPLYWFPRECPRVTAWPRDDIERTAFAEAFVTDATRVHSIELGWLPTMTTTTIYRYRFADDVFQPWVEASGQWISSEPVEPLGVVPFDDLLALHVAAGIELRAVPNLWPIRDLAVSDRWDFSIVRFQGATPRAPSDARP